jgi:hypothetical protein
MSDSALHNMSYVAEVTYGVTPAVDPAFIDLRHTGTTLGLAKESFMSEELHADRQIRDFRHGVKSVGGDVSIELSYGSFDDFLEASLLGAWAGDVLKAGTTRRSFSVLRHFTDLDAANTPYELFNGVELNTLSLTIPASGMVTGSFGVIGKGLELLDDLTSLGTPTFGPVTDTAPFDSFTGSIMEAGSSISVVTEVSLSLTNGLAIRTVVGSDETIQPTIGKSNLTGSITAFFEDSVLLSKFLDEVESSLEVTLTDPDGNSYVIELPRIKYNGGQPDVAGEGSISLTLPIQALYDVTDLSQLVITRIPAV